MSVVQIASQLSARLSELSFAPPVACVYDPLVYAWAPHSEYLRRFVGGHQSVVLLGMNPGPWGMAQTGVPFGEVAAARDWMGIDLRVEKPAQEHPKRPVLGGDCPRSEVSGRRLWGWVADRFGAPEAFFARFTVLNYCPLCFMEESGRNRIPEKLPLAERQPLFEACDHALRETVRVIDPELVIGVGAFAAKRARAVLGDLGPRFGQILHPSPASPAANRGWAEQVERQLTELGVELPPRAT